MQTQSAGLLSLYTEEHGTLLLLFFKVGSLYVAQAGLELKIFLLLVLGLQAVPLHLALSQLCYLISIHLVLGLTLQLMLPCN